jgi:type II secretory pathway component PulK
LNPPYYAKDGPIDDLSELLWIKGISPEMFPAFEENFTVLSADPTGRVNINTAPASVLAIFFNGDIEAAERVVSLRSETPAGSPTCPDVPTLLINAGFSGPQAQQLAPRFSVKSTVFRVEVTPLQSSRRYVGVIGRSNPQDVRVLSFHWENPTEKSEETDLR